MVVTCDRALEKKCRREESEMLPLNQLIPFLTKGVEPRSSYEIQGAQNATVYLVDLNHSSALRLLNQRVSLDQTLH